MLYLTDIALPSLVEDMEDDGIGGVVMRSSLIRWAEREAGLVRQFGLHCSLLSEEGLEDAQEASERATALDLLEARLEASTALLVVLDTLALFRMEEVAEA